MTETNTSKPLRIIQVINVRWFNATAWYGLFLGKLLAKQGHKVLILCLKNTQTEKKVQESGVAYETLDLNSNNPRVILDTFSKLKKLLSQFRPHVVNCHRGEGFILFGILKKILSPSFALIRTRGDQRLPKKNIFNLYLHRKIASAVIATNSYMYKHFIHNFKLNPDKTHLIIGGVDENLFYFSSQEREKIRNKYQYSKENFVVGLLGRFDRVKGQKELIQAISHLYHEEKLKQIRLLLIGFDTALKTHHIQNWLRQYKIEHITNLTGKVDFPRKYICALDLGVVASLYSETIIRAGLEIMACKRPLIGTKVGVLPDILDENALVPPKNYLQLAQKIKHCMQENFRKNLLATQEEKLTKLSSQEFYLQTLNVYLNSLKRENS